MLNVAPALPKKTKKKEKMTNKMHKLTKLVLSNSKGKNKVSFQH